jgi:hypothetical protein
VREGYETTREQAAELYQSTAESVSEGYQATREQAAELYDAGKTQIGVGSAPAEAPAEAPADVPTGTAESVPNN